jgi:PAS domain S-box-containing protein
MADDSGHGITDQMKMKKLKILYLEDSATDADLAERLLKKSGLDFTMKIVSNRKDYVEALETYDPDVILSDHSLFQFDSLEALALYKQSKYNIPFILVTGAVSEEFAVTILKEGADDYLLKGNLIRLPNAILQAYERKKAENEREMANENLQILFENIDEVFFSIDMINNKFLQVSDACIKIYGIESSEFYKDSSLWLKVIHPDDAKIREEIEALSGNGSVIKEYRIIRPDKNIYWVHSKLVTTLNENGKLARIDGVTSNITSQKTAEKNLEDKCYDLSSLMYRLSHDLKGPLVSTEGLINVSKAEITDPKALKYIGMIELANNRLVKILNGIIQLIKTDAVNPIQKINFEDIIDNITQFYKDNPETANIKFIVDVSVKRDFYCDEASIHSVLYNLINNAVLYRGKTDPYVKIVISENGDHINMEVKDNGVGIPEQFQSKIFDMFFKANEYSTGSGLGLFIVKSILTKFNGSIAFNSIPGRGTMFTLHFPFQTKPDEVV